MSICIEVEGIAGTFEGAMASDLTILANRLGIIVHGKHNGVMMMANPGEAQDRVLARFQDMARLEKAGGHEARPTSTLPTDVALRERCALIAASVKPHDLVGTARKLYAFVSGEEAETRISGPPAPFVDTGSG